MIERAAIFNVTPEALAELLQLPAGAYIDHVQTDETLGSLRLRVRGIGPEVRRGDRLTEIRPILTKHTAVHTTVAWQGVGS